MLRPPVTHATAADANFLFGNFVAVGQYSRLRSGNSPKTVDGTQKLAEEDLYSVLFLNQGVSGEEHTALDIYAIREEIRSIGTSCPVVFYGTEASEFEQIVSDFNTMFVDVHLMARILLPGLKAYQLKNITNFLRFSEVGGMQSTYAVRATAWVYLKLLDILRTLEHDTLSILIRLLGSTGTGLEWVFSEMMRSRPAGKFSLQNLDPNQQIVTFDRGSNTIGDGSCEPIEDAKEFKMLNPTELAGMFDTGGLFERRIEGYERRAQQISMVQSVAKAFNEGEVLLVEAGTGTGKSLSYLAPALIWAVQNDQRVVISTNTRNLQEQLYYKDLPFLLENLGLASRATLLKGRSNYLCLDRWHRVMQNPQDNLTPEEREVVIALVVWVQETKTGDISEHAVFNNELGEGLWGKINGEGTACPRCVFQDECFVNRARADAVASHITVVNHALLFSDLQADHAVLSKYTHLIIDEAHNLERAAVHHLTIEIGGWRMRNVLSKMYTPERGGTGVLFRLAKLAAQVSEKQEWKNSLDSGTRIAIDRLMKVNRQIEAFFQVATDEARAYSSSQSNQNTKLRYRANEGYTKILRSAAPSLIEGCARLRESLGTLQEHLGHISDAWLDDREAHMNDMQATVESIRKMEEDLVLLTRAGEEEWVYWVEASQAYPMSSLLIGAPLRVAKQLHDDLFSVMRTVVLTSATLTVADSFHYQVEKLGLDRIVTPRLKLEGIGSPFDYRDQMLACVPEGFPSPRSEDFQASVSQIILDLVMSANRNALVLFTSYSQLNQTFKDIEPSLSEAGVVVMAQGISGPRSALLERFRQCETALLLGTDSFWEGIDVPGKALEMVILVKLPFAVPFEPLVQAQVERFDKIGRNGFLEYQVPEAVIKFRQGVGRLIRSTKDYGVVTILDQRVISTAYGRIFLESLPIKSEIFSDADTLVEGVTYWFTARDKRNIKECKG